MHSADPGFTPGDAKFKSLFGHDHGECDEHEACHVAQFTVGEIIPLKGGRWQVESCEGLTLMLKYVGETGNSKRKLAAKQKARKKRRRRR
jgi:hypothetical protein